MDQNSRQILGSAMILLALHIATATPAKSGITNPVYEVINEQARIDQDIRQSTAILPYGNPLAGNSQKNARLHAQNQQAMFNAERIRQHRAQLQRWAQIPHLDSYMQAYHDSQETHQLAVEKQQARDISPIVHREQKKIHSETKLRRNPNPKPDILKKGVRVIPEVEKITKADAVLKAERNRHHRSYGSVGHQQYLQPKMYKTVYLSPGPTYDQGVTIKPNGNIGLAGQQVQGEGNKLFTEAVPSKTQYQYVYPKQYSQMQGYESAQEISTLNSLLKKNPQEQLSELNALINLSKGTGEKNTDELETPIDISPIVHREQKKIHSETKLRRNPNPKPDILKKGVRVIPEVEKITKADAVLKAERNRHHRSYGSVGHQQYLQPKMYKTVYLSPGPTYDQGVTIKPNGNIGLAGQQVQGEGNKLFTEAVPSKTQYQYVYPKQYSQMQGYESAQEISTLNSLLKKNPQEQLSELNALINLSKGTGEKNTDELETPIDLYFYMKDPPAQSVLQHYDQALYNQEQPPTYASAYTQSTKDYTPITEEIDDVEDPNKNPKLKTYGVQAVLAPQEPEVPIETTTTKSNNYYKVEVASQTISSGPKPKTKFQYYVKGHEDDVQKLEYIQPLKQYLKKEENEGDESERYLHHNAQHKGVQHLSEDGTGVSAYDDDLHYAANYEFGYRVRDHHSGNDFGHHEAMSDGHTQGHYHVLLPDGRMQKVRYSAGPGGFHADISYDHLH